MNLSHIANPPNRRWPQFLYLSVLSLCFVNIFLCFPLFSETIQMVPQISSSFSVVETTGKLSLHYDHAEKYPLTLIGDRDAIAKTKFQVVNGRLKVDRPRWTPRYEKLGYNEIFRVFAFSVYFKKLNGFPFLAIRFSTNSDRNMKLVIGKSSLRKIAMTDGVEFSMDSYENKKRPFTFVFTRMQEVDIAVKIPSLALTTTDVASLNMDVEANAMDYSIAGAGGSTLKGKVRNGNVLLREDFKMKAEELIFSTLVIDIGKNSSAFVYAEKKIIANINEEAFLGYEGGAETSIKKINPTGEVVKN